MGRPGHYISAVIPREKIELALIGAAGATSWLAFPLLPVSLPAGSFALVAAALLLGQGLVRDLWLKYGAPGVPSLSSSSRTSVCAESGLGVVGVLAGGALLGAGAGGQLAMTALRWALLVWSVGALGFGLKDVVLDLRARRWRIEKDHRSIVIW